MYDRGTEKPSEACGVFGIYAPGEEVARITFFGLYALQHRGQESAGIATTNGERIYHHTRMGLVAQAFEEEDLAGLPGHIAIGHNRYSTTGSSKLVNAQPIYMESTLGPFALGHNGNLTNANHLRDALLADGEQFNSSSDSEVIAKMLAIEPGRTWEEKIQRVMPRLAGAYSLVLLTTDSLIGIRDPLGMRPLCLGKLKENWLIASESCALDTVGGKLEREMRPGEVVSITHHGLRSQIGQFSEKSALCLFEYIYFARPDSIIHDRSLYAARQRMGVQLAAEYQVEADLVIGVPDSAIPAAVGYANARGIPYDEGLIKNRYIGRTFIQPNQSIREVGIKLKYNPLRHVLEGKRIVVIDDSIVRGTTIGPMVQLLRRAGATEVHVGVASPPVKHPCFFGVDMAGSSELIASQYNTQAIARAVGADSLHYLSLEGLVVAINLPMSTFCRGCFTGTYPVPVQLDLDKLTLEKVGV